MVLINIKKTPARSSILDFLNISSFPVDVKQIIDYLHSKKLNTNKVTVYRILDVLYKNGIIERVEFGEGKFRYEVKGKNHHHHLICTKCGKIEDVKGEYMDNLQEEIYKNKGFKVTYHSLEFFGVCKACLNKQN